MSLENLTNNYIKKNNFNPSKKMGQNFLINDNLSNQIFKAIDTNTDFIVEIGPGLGAITQHLIKLNVPIATVELDKRLADYISNTFKVCSVINNDVLNIDFDDIIDEKYKNPILISNLPYSISTLVLLKFLKCQKINTFYCMLQKEVVDRIFANVSTKQYSSFSVLFKYFCETKLLLNISRTNFYPIPNVDSVFIEIKKNIPFDLGFANFIKFCFQSRRQTLINNLKKNYLKDEIIKVLMQNKIDLRVRSEELTPDILFNIYNSLR